MRRREFISLLGGGARPHGHPGDGRSLGMRRFGMQAESCSRRTALPSFVGRYSSALYGRIEAILAAAPDRNDQRFLAVFM
jgi:hypothetical protein